MSIRRTLTILTATSVVVSTASAQGADLAGCYRLVWANPRVTAVLPDSVRLDTLASPVWHKGAGILQIRPTNFLAGSSVQWGYIGQAWWWQTGPGSAMISYSRAAAHWLISLHRTADSLVGIARFFMGDSGTPPMAVTAIRVLCIPNLPSTDSAYDADFKCPESYSSAKKARSAATAFTQWVTAHHPTWTSVDSVTFRLQLLVNHNCWDTLEHIRTHPDSGGGA
jgi:hypothetical protein